MAFVFEARRKFDSNQTSVPINVGPGSYIPSEEEYEKKKLQKEQFEKLQNIRKTISNNYAKDRCDIINKNILSNPSPGDYNIEKTNSIEKVVTNNDNEEIKILEIPSNQAVFKSQFDRFKLSKPLTEIPGPGQYNVLPTFQDLKILRSGSTKNLIGEKLLENKYKKFMPQQKTVSIPSKINYELEALKNKLEDIEKNQIHIKNLPNRIAKKPSFKSMKNYGYAQNHNLNIGLTPLHQKSNNSNSLANFNSGSPMIMQNGQTDTVFSQKKQQNAENENLQKQNQQQFQQFGQSQTTKAAYSKSYSIKPLTQITRKINPESQDSNQELKIQGNEEYPVKKNKNKQKTVDLQLTYKQSKFYKKAKFNYKLDEQYYNQHEANYLEDNEKPGQDEDEDSSMGWDDDTTTPGPGYYDVNKNLKNIYYQQRTTSCFGSTEERFKEKKPESANQENKQLTSQKSEPVLNWNIKKPPFQSSNSRFKLELLQEGQPGPADYFKEKANQIENKLIRSRQKLVKFETNEKRFKSMDVIDEFPGPGAYTGENASFGKKYDPHMESEDEKETTKVSQTKKFDFPGKLGRNELRPEPGQYDVGYYNIEKKCRKPDEIEKPKAINGNAEQNLLGFCTSSPRFYDLTKKKKNPNNEAENEEDDDEEDELITYSGKNKNLLDLAKKNNRNQIFISQATRFKYLGNKQINGKEQDIYPDISQKCNLIKRTFNIKFVDG